jgi:hypothetical protein
VAERLTIYVNSKDAKLAFEFDSGYSGAYEMDLGAIIAKVDEDTVHWGVNVTKVDLAPDDWVEVGEIIYKARQQSEGVT